MRQLIWKDFIIQKRSVWLYLAMGFLMLYYFKALDQQNVFAVQMPAFMITYGFMNRSMSEDEKNHTIRMLLTLPISRAVIVKAKFASVAIAGLGSMALLLAAGAVTGAYSFDNPDDRLLNLLTFALIALIDSILVSVFMPMVYKMGVIRAQSINRFIFFGIFFLGMTAGTIAEVLTKRLNLSGEPPAWLAWIGRSGSLLERMNPYTGIGMLFVLTVIIYLVSMRLSIRFLNRREVF